MGEPLLHGPVAAVAPRLLGSRLTHGPVTIRVTEVEAYGGPDDPGSHAYRGRTARNATMFDEAGLLYCYLVYGMHHCCNVVTGPAGQASAVLVRAGEVEHGEDAVRTRRGGVPWRDLARGPGRLSRALDLDRRHDGHPLLAADSDPALSPGRPIADSSVAAGPRVGLRAGAEVRWRFWLRDHPCVSDYRPARWRPGR